ELVLVGANVIHGWQQHNCAQEDIHEITIHFHEKLLSRELLSRNLLKPIRDMLQRAQYGILFSEETTQHIFTRLQKLAQTQGISQFLEMFSILHEMAVSEDQRLLTSTLKEIKDYYQHDPLLDLHQIIHMRYKEKLTLEEVAEKLKMSVPSFCRFIKKRTGKTFIQYVNEIRIAHASRQLIETDQTIAEIAFASGFNNLANFNRLFKKKKQMTPTTYRTQYVGFKRVL
ncbi:MAG: helix-turn-helix domain-containing protein, partial [Bacteroidota bacterium]